MARRGSNSFKRNDGLRALKIARDGGLEPAVMEVAVAKDGSVIYRVYGESAVPMPTTVESGVSREWRDEIDKLKKPK